MINEKLRALPRDVPHYHERQAAHLRALAQQATTRKIKQRLLDQAEEHERAASGEEMALASDEEQSGPLETSLSADARGTAEFRLARS